MEDEEIPFEGDAAMVAAALKALRDGPLGQMGMLEMHEPVDGRPFLCAQPGFGSPLSAYIRMREPSRGAAGQIRRRLRRLLDGV